MALNVWNTLDEIGLYSGLERFSYEVDESLFNRLKRFSKWKYKTDYLTQVHSMSIQTDTEYFNVLEVFSTVENNEFKCDCDWEYFTLEDSTEYLRVFINTEGCQLSKILAGIDALANFDYKIFKSKYVSFNTKYLIRNKNYASTRDLIVDRDTNLTHKNLMAGSLSSDSDHILNKKTNIQEVLRPGDYFIEEATGFLHIYQDNPDPFYINYKYYNPRFIIEGCNMNLIPLNIIAKYGITDKLVLLLPSILDGQIWGK